MRACAACGVEEALTAHRAEAGQARQPLGRDFLASQLSIVEDATSRRLCATRVCVCACGRAVAHSFACSRRPLLYAILAHFLGRGAGGGFPGSTSGTARAGARTAPPARAVIVEGSAAQS